VTGDLGSLDKEGYLTVHGRERDLIIRGGLNISPREIEELLLRHPNVGEAAVVGTPDPRYGERICAFVVPAGSDTGPNLDELLAMLSEAGVARYKYPEQLIRLAQLPLTVTGKVRHQALRELLEGQVDPKGQTESSGPKGRGRGELELGEAPTEIVG
jgi:cyclohexanecarboxylate-CoA ligase